MSSVGGNRQPVGKQSLLGSVRVSCASYRPLLPIILNHTYTDTHTRRQIYSHFYIWPEYPVAGASLTSSPSCTIFPWSLIVCCTVRPFPFRFLFGGQPCAHSFGADRLRYAKLESVFFAHKLSFYGFDWSRNFLFTPNTPQSPPRCEITTLHCLLNSFHIFLACLCWTFSNLTLTLFPPLVPCCSSQASFPH